MAKDVITRFKLETTQYDSKLRDASKGMAEYAKTATAAGKEFDKFTKANVAAAQAMGNIAPSANNAKDKVKELVTAYNDLAKAYNALTKEQQSSDFGRAMAESMGKLKTQIAAAKQELYGMGDAMKEMTSGSSGFTNMLAVFGGNMLTKGVSMLTSELVGSVQESIELAKQGEGVRMAFERINKPGLLENLKEATHGTVSELELMKQAVKFENFKLPLEDLATYLAFAQQKAKDTGESVDYMVNSITTGLGRQSKQILDNLGISAAELTKRMGEGATMTQAVADIIREEMQKAGDYVETAADRAAQAAAKASDEMEKFGRSAAPIAEEWGQTWNALTISAMDFANTLLGPVAASIRSIQGILDTTLDDRRIHMFEALEKIGSQQRAKSGYQGMGDLQKVTAPGGYVVVTDSYTGEVIGGQHFDNLDDKNGIKTWRKSLFKSGGKSGGRGSKKKSTESMLLSTFNKNTSKFDASSLMEQTTSGPSEIFRLMQQQHQQELKNIKLDSRADFEAGRARAREQIENMEDPMKYAKKQLATMDAIAGNIGNITSGMAKMGIELPEGITAMVEGIQTVISIISSIMTLVTLISSIQSVKSIPIIGWALANGGILGGARGRRSIHAATGIIVPGNNYSGDRVPAFVNSGELILNRAQQGNIASQLQGGGMQNMNLQAIVTGEQLRFILNTNSRRRGKGEYVTSTHQ